MSPKTERFDFVVIGAGPAGQKAAVQAAKAGRRVLVVDREAMGGECVHRGTIPTKTLRETAIYLSGLHDRTQGVLAPVIRPDAKVESLMRRQDAVRRANEEIVRTQLERNDIAMMRGRARFTSPHELEVKGVRGGVTRVAGEIFVIATGSRPRTPPEIPVDHEHILDSDSILSLVHLPASLIVLGAGVIACEFATLFAALGVQVTIVDRGARALPFMDEELTTALVEDFTRRGGRYLPNRRIERVETDGFSTVTAILGGGERVTAAKMLCALGRVPQISDLGLEAAGLEPGPRGTIVVDEHFRTAVAHIYAAGDVVGPPALAASSMDQGRRAARHALGLQSDTDVHVTPAGIYTIPEMASVGLTEREAVEKFGAAAVGRASFREIARGQINGDLGGLLKLVADPDGGRVLGAHIVGEGATELIHLAQLAIAAGLDADAFVENVFNFPTMAEAYRVAALDIGGRRERLREAA